MNNNRLGASFLITTLFYIILASLFFYFQTKTIKLSEKPKEKSIKIALSQFVPESEPEETPPQSESKIKPMIEPVIESIEPIAKPEITTEPVIIKPKISPKIKKKKVIQKRAKKRTEKKATKRKDKTRKRTVSSKPKQTMSKHRFMSILRSKIERGKSYPRMAERRGMQGSVKVRFKILSNGHVSSISLKGPKVFQSSAKKAVKGAFPVDVKSAPFSLPTTVNLTLRYRIK
jgi:protein TonB